MNEPQSQGDFELQIPDTKMTPEEAKASLGIATHLQNQLLPQGQDSQTSNPAPEAPTNQTTPEDTQAQMQGLESRLMDELQTLKAEIKKTAPKDSGSEIENLKQEIDAVLNSND